MSRARLSAGTVAAALYLLAVALVELARALWSAPDPALLASSPAGVAAGELWPLLSSGLVVAGAPVVQLAGLAVVALALIRAAGAGTFWRAAAAGHVGATLLAYAGVAVLWVLARADVEGAVDAPDYGVSCVWAGALGGLAVLVARRRAAAGWLSVAILVPSLVVFVVAVPFSLGLVGAEHDLALVLGGVVALRLPALTSVPPDGRPHRS